MPNPADRSASPTWTGGRTGDEHYKEEREGCFIEIPPFRIKQRREKDGAPVCFFEGQKNLGHPAQKKGNQRWMLFVAQRNQGIQSNCA